MNAKNTGVDLNESSMFVSYIGKMSGLLDSEKDSHSTKFEWNP